MDASVPSDQIQGVGWKPFHIDLRGGVNILTDIQLNFDISNPIISKTPITQIFSRFPLHSHKGYTGRRSLLLEAKSLELELENGAQTSEIWMRVKVRPL